MPLWLPWGPVLLWLPWYSSHESIRESRSLASKARLRDESSDQQSLRRGEAG